MQSKGCPVEAFLGVMSALTMTTGTQKDQNETMEVALELCPTP
jgi:hypothetical protein